MYSTRFIAGTGIGGEYAAINSAIDEMMPSRYRGRVDICINGTFATFLLLNSLPENPSLAGHARPRPGGRSGDATDRGGVGE